MIKNKTIYNVVFIVITAILLLVFVEYGEVEKYIGFALMPMIIAYYLGQIVERKTGEE